MDPQNPKDRLVTKDELNLVEFPFTLAAHRAPKSVQRIVVSEVKLDPGGRPLTREWTVHPSGYGLPLAMDEEVFLGLMHFLYLADFREPTVHFSQHRLFRLLGWSGSQESYERLELSLRRLKGAVIECKDSFWDHDGKAYVTHGFSLIESYSLYRRDSKSFEQPFISQVTFNNRIFQSFKSGFIKSLDLKLYLSLKSPLARKLFRFLDKKLYRSETYEIELMRLASRLALTDKAYPSDVKKQLDRSAHAELQSIGFLESVRYVKRGHSTSIRYEIAPATKWSFPIAEAKETPQDDPLVLELVARGVTRDVARALLKDHGDKRVADKLEVFDHLRSENSTLIAKNPAGFLRQSIERDFAPPTGYITRAERQRLKKEELEAKQRQAAREKAEQQAEEAREAAFQKLWNSLSDEEKQTLEAQVLLGLNNFARKAYRQEKAAGKVGPGHHALRAAIHEVLSSRLPFPASETLK
jgi:hypothetical protein